MFHPSKADQLVKYRRGKHDLASHTSPISQASKLPLPTKQHQQDQEAPSVQGPEPRTVPAVMTTSIGWILQGGVLLSAAIIVLGLLLLPSRSGGFSPQRVLAFPQTFSQVVAGLLVLRPQAVITLGLLLLISTPILRVAASMVAFAVERDRRYVVITLIVLVILLCSLFYGGMSLTRETATDVHHFHFSLSVVLLIFLGSLLAGLLGSLVGLGGGVLIVPMLTLVFGFPISLAIGASIISVIATSSGAAVAYVKDRITNLRIGMFLELGTTIGALCGAYLAGLFAPAILSVIFGIILLVSTAPLVLKFGEELPQSIKNDRWANWLHLDGSYPDHRLHREVCYQVTRTPLGLVMMYIAGLVSGLLGIGSGTFKVLALDTAMRLPMKVSTTTSNFMIGVTAATSAGIYFARGDILPLLAAPVALGILIGALVGVRLLAHLSNRILRTVFLVVMVVVAIEMVLHGWGIA